MTTIFSEYIKKEIMTYGKTRQIYEALLNRVVKISLILLQFDKKKLLKLTLA